MGTQRIAINLQTPPPYIVTLLESVTGTPWVPVTLSRQTVNDVLKKHELNGSPYKNKRDRKYFKATQPDEMWQIDLRGPIRIDNIRRYVLVILDDYSRYLIYCRFCEHITTETVLTVFQKIIKTKHRSLQKILGDNSPQFKETFTDTCVRMGIEVIHAPPHYPQCKGKVELVIRTFNEEYLRVCNIFDNSLQLMSEFQTWYNDSRFNMGISGCPTELYNQSFNVTDVT
ncbi:MAG: DDE-type integrase/transposase/recombinase [Candidatus Thermoplasmatota archaeon]